MLEAVGCWNLNWNAIGAVATSVASITAIWIATSQAREKRTHNEIRMKIALTQLGPELGNIFKFSKDMSVINGAFLNEPGTLNQLKSFYSAPSVSVILTSYWGISEDVGISAAKLSVLCNQMLKYIDFIDRKGLDNKIPDLIQELAGSINLTIKELAQNLIKIQPDARKNLGEILGVDAEIAQSEAS